MMQKPFMLLIQNLNLPDKSFLEYIIRIFHLISIVLYNLIYFHATLKNILTIFLTAILVKLVTFVVKIFTLIKLHLILGINIVKILS